MPRIIGLRFPKEKKENAKAEKPEDKTAEKPEENAKAEKPEDKTAEKPEENAKEKAK